MSEKDNYRFNLASVIHIQNDLLKNSKGVDVKIRDAFLNNGNYWLNRIENESFTRTQLKSIANDILTYWQESIGTLTESFWLELSNRNIDFERKDELIFALEKKRFRRVDISMCARKDWSFIRDSMSIKNRFSSDQIEQIEKIIEDDEKSRFEILQKCLNNKRIPKSQYLLFGECMAYMTNCELWDKYFDAKDKSELYELWSNK